MEHHFKELLANLHPRETRELIEDHVRKIEINAPGKTVTLLVDKRYAFNAIISHEHIDQVLAGVKKTFGAEFETAVQLAAPHFPSEREKALPHTISYH